MLCVRVFAVYMCMLSMCCVCRVLACMCAYDVHTCNQMLPPSICACCQCAVYVVFLHVCVLMMYTHVTKHSLPLYVHAVNVLCMSCACMYVCL